MEKDPARITKIKSFINKYNWEGINVPPEKDDWKKIVANALKIFYVKKEKIYSAYVSKHNAHREKQVFIMIPNGEKQQYLTVKNYQQLSELHSNYVFFISPYWPRIGFYIPIYISASFAQVT